MPTVACCLQSQRGRFVNGSAKSLHSVVRPINQPDFFAVAPAAPEGFRFKPEVINKVEEQELAQAFGLLSFKEFEFQGFFGKRRVVSFGWRYDFNGASLSKCEPIPAFLLPIRAKAAAFAGLPQDAIEHVLLTEYRRSPKPRFPNA